MVLISFYGKFRRLIIIRFIDTTKLIINGNYCKQYSKKVVVYCYFKFFFTFDRNMGVKKNPELLSQVAPDTVFYV